MANNPQLQQLLEQIVSSANGGQGIGSRITQNQDELLKNYQEQHAANEQERQMRDAQMASFTPKKSLKGLAIFTDQITGSNYAPNYKEPDNASDQAKLYSELQARYGTNVRGAAQTLNMAQDNDLSLLRMLESKREGALNRQSMRDIAQRENMAVRDVAKSEELHRKAINALDTMKQTIESGNLFDISAMKPMMNKAMADSGNIGEKEADRALPLTFGEGLKCLPLVISHLSLVVRLPFPKIISKNC